MWSSNTEGYLLHALVSRGIDYVRVLCVAQSLSLRPLSKSARLVIKQMLTLLRVPEIQKCCQQPRLVSIVWKSMRKTSWSLAMPRKTGGYPTTDEHTPIAPLLRLVQSAPAYSGTRARRRAPPSGLLLF